MFQYKNKEEEEREYYQKKYEEEKRKLMEGDGAQWTDHDADERGKIKTTDRQNELRSKPVNKGNNSNKTEHRERRRRGERSTVMW